jgi:subtilase family serine protease
MRIRLGALGAIAGLLVVAVALTGTAPTTAPRADLVPTRITPIVKPVGVAGTCEATLVALVKNRGAANAAGYAVQFMIDGQAFSVEAPRGIGAGRTSTKSLGVPVAPGAHTVTVTVDPADGVAESNKANNSLSSAFTCQ